MTRIFRSTPAACMVLLPNVPNFTIVEASDAFLTAKSIARKDVIGKPLFQALPDIHQHEDSPDLTYSLLYVLEHKSPHRMAIQRAGSRQGLAGEQYWVAENTPVLDEEGEITHIIHTIRNVTDRVLAEKFDEAGKRMLIRTERAGRTYAWQWNALTGRLKLSESLYDFLGITPRSVAPDPDWLYSLIHANDREHFNLLCAHLKTKPAKFEIQLRIAAGENDFRTCLVTGEPDGFSQSMSGHLIDVTEKKDLEQSLRESERLFRSAFEYSPIGIALVAADRNYIRVNKSFCELVGYSEAELFELNVAAITHPDDLRDDEHCFEELQSGKVKNLHREKRYVHKRGETIWASVSVSAVTATSGEFLYYVVQIQDITEKKKIELALKKSEQEYKSLFEQNPDAVFLLDMAGRIMSANRAGNTLLATNSRDIAGTRLVDFATDQDKSKVSHFLSEARAGKGLNVELSIHSALGADVLLNITTMPVVVNDLIEGVYCIAKDISEKNRLERMIRAERERFADLFTSAPVSMAILKGPDHVFEKANELYYKLSGRTNISGKTVREVFPEAEGQGIFEVMDEVYATGKPYTAMSRLIRIDIDGDGLSEDIYLNFLFQPFRDGDGHTEGIFFFGVDVTSQVVATTKAEQREKQYGDLIEQMPAAVFTTDQHGKLLLYNKAAVTLWGKEPVRGAIWSLSWQLHSPDGKVLDDEDSPVSAVLKARRSVDFSELLVIRPDRQVRYVQPFPSPLLDVNGNLAGAVVVMSDVTQRRLTENELQKLSVIAKKTRDAIIITDPGGYIEWVNEAFTTQTEYDFQEVVGKRTADFLHGPGTAPETRRLIAEQMERGEAFEFEVMKYSKSKRPYWVEIKGQPLFDESGTLTHFFEIETDITERKQAYEELIRKENEIRRFAKQLNNVLEEERSRIAREIHDEFGQQLTGLKMSLSALQKLQPADRAYKETMQDMSSGIENSIQALRNFATELRPGILDTLGMIPSIEWLVREFEKKSGVSSTLRVNTRRRSFDKAISTTYFRICQEALTNIARHAAASRVEVEVTESDGSLSLTVADNGRGISAEKIEDPYSMGLLGIRERARLIGADLFIGTGQDAGTRIRITVKLNEE